MTSSHTALFTSWLLASQKDLLIIVEPRAMHILGKCSTTELYIPPAWKIFLIQNSIENHKMLIFHESNIRINTCWNFSAIGFRLFLNYRTIIWQSSKPLCIYLCP
jgi:hypothetical protein